MRATKSLLANPGVMRAQATLAALVALTALSACSPSAAGDPPALTVTQLKKLMLSPSSIGSGVQVLSEFDSGSPPAQQQLAAYPKAVNSSQQCTDLTNSFVTATVSSLSAGAYVNITFRQATQTVAGEWIGSFGSVSTASQAMGKLESDMKSCQNPRVVANGRPMSVSLQSTFSSSGSPVMPDTNASLSVVATFTVGGRQKELAMVVMQLGSQLICLQAGDLSTAKHLARQAQAADYLLGGG